MTSCLLVKSPDRLVAVADGRLSVSPSTVSFDNTMKIVRIVPQYRIPRVMMTRFSHYDTYTGRACYVAYAGTYALVEQVMQVFRRRITEGLVLVWEDGRTVLSENGFDEGTVYLDYPFLGADCPDITARDVVAEFRAAAQEKCDEFCANRKEPADCEFLLFGQDDRHDYWAYRILVDPAWSPGGPVRIGVEEIADGVLAGIGSTRVVGAAFADGELLAGLQGWRLDQQRLGMYAARDLDDLLTPGRPLERSGPDPRNWSSDEVIARFRRLLDDSGDFSVGGAHTVARGGWYGEVSLKSVG